MVPCLISQVGYNFSWHMILSLQDLGGVFSNAMNGLDELLHPDPYLIY